MAAKDLGLIMKLPNAARQVCEQLKMQACMMRVKENEGGEQAKSGIGWRIGGGEDGEPVRTSSPTRTPQQACVTTPTYATPQTDANYYIGLHILHV